MEIMGLAAAKSGKTMKDSGGAKIASIISRAFADRTYAHMAHLKTSSFAAHKALDDFYSDIVGLVDGLAETAQGKFGKLSIPVGQVSSDMSNAADVLEMSLDEILKDSADCKVRALCNIVDEIEGLYLSTIYKLRELH